LVPTRQEEREQMDHCILRQPRSKDGTVRKMGGAGDSPAPVGDPPTGMGEVAAKKRASRLAADALAIPSGESPDGTGW
jgi:hypothetical protein